MSNGPKFAIVEARINARNRSAVEDFARLAGISTERKLKPAESKRFARLQTQLMRTGVVVPLTKQVVTQHARVLYHSLPWWKKLSLRARYYLRSVRNRVEVLRLRIRLRS
jgi:hypothetical protein